MNVLEMIDHIEERNDEGLHLNYRKVPSIIAKLQAGEELAAVIRRALREKTSFDELNVALYDYELAGG